MIPGRQLRQTFADGWEEPGVGSAPKGEGMDPRPTPASEVSAQTVNGSDLRRALQAHGAGVVIVTTAGPEGPAGLTVTSFTSLSLNPPLISFSIGRKSSTLAAFRMSSCFAVHVLGSKQHELAQRFAAKGADRFAPPTEWTEGPLGVPILNGALAHMICTRHAVLGFGDHSLFVGCVIVASKGQDGPALVHHQGVLRAL